MKNRRVEFLSATIMVGWAAVMAMPGNTLSERAAFSSMIDRGWTEVQLATILGGFGIVWLAALWINGNYRRSPVIRCICAGGGVVMWTTIAYGMTKTGFDTGVWSTGLAVYWVLALFDLASCYRSAADAYIAHVHGKILDEAAAASRHEP